jgi:hypothetical protein
MMGEGEYKTIMLSAFSIKIKPATGEGMDKSTLAYAQIQIIIIHFLPSPIPPIRPYPMDN